MARITERGKVVFSRGEGQESFGNKIARRMIRLSSSCRTRPREVEPHDERKHLKIRMPGGQERNSKEFEALVKSNQEKINQLGRGRIELRPERRLDRAEIGDD